jgi:hypothetical protein
MGEEKPLYEMVTKDRVNEITDALRKDGGHYMADDVAKLLAERDAALEALAMLHRDAGGYESGEAHDVARAEVAVILQSESTNNVSTTSRGES